MVTRFPNHCSGGGIQRSVSVQYQRFGLHIKTLSGLSNWKDLRATGGIVFSSEKTMFMYYKKI